MDLRARELDPALGRFLSADSVQQDVSLSLGFTGELTDPTTGFVDLRARELDPTLGRFLAADTMQPNAPGSQGYNFYAYVANNPTTWTDPSGHSFKSALDSILTVALACRLTQECWQYLAEGVARMQVGIAERDWRVFTGGFVISAFSLVLCALTPECIQLSQDIQLIVTTYGGGVDTGGGNRPPSPAHCIADAVEAYAANGGSAADAIRVCAAAIRNTPVVTTTSTGTPVYPVRGGSGPVIPPKAYDVYNYARSHNGAAPPGYAGNKVFDNRWNQLPPGGDYREYDIDPRPLPNTGGVAESAS